MGRTPSCSKEDLNRGAWTATEDRILTQYIEIHGEGNWRQLPKRAGLKRCGKSCRLRWLNYLRPDIKRGNITHDEEELIIRLHSLLGNRWSLIAGRLPGRTDNEIKNYWNTNFGKRAQNGNPKSSISPNSSQHKTNLKTQQQTPNPSNMDSPVIRTKASRCTKVIVTPDPEPQQLGPVVASSMTYDDDKMEAGKGMELGLGSGLLPSTPPFSSEGNNPLDIMAGFEMDQSFFSDLLKITFSETSCFERTVKDNSISVRNKSQSSQRSDDNDTPLPSTVILGEAEFDWL